MANGFEQFLRDKFPHGLGVCEPVHEEEGAAEREMLHALLHVTLYNFHQLNDLRKQVYTMSQTIATRADLDAALASLLQAEAARDQVVITALNDLAAKVAAGTVTTPEDFSAELATVTTLATNASTLTQTATADDPGPTTVPTTPVTPAPAS